jgi:cytochrome c
MEWYSMSRTAILLAIAASAVALPALAQDAKTGEAVFKRICSICHSPLQGTNMVGPSLFEVVGRKSGSVSGFRYSKANSGSEIVWTVNELDPYLANPRAVLPGTTMTYAGLKDPAQRAAVIAYLQTLK